MFESINELYVKGYGVCKIGETLNISRFKVLSILKKNGIITKRITRPYKNLYNIKFFSEYNEKSAYWAGFILADGNIHSKRKFLQIALSDKDKEHLVKFSNDIEFTGGLYYYEKTNSSKIVVNGEWFHSDLNKNYGIESKKTFTSKFPEIPNVFIKHFIRGIFDGDGSITKISKYNYAVSITNNFDILNFISKHFYEILGIRIRNKTGYPKIVSRRFTKEKTIYL